MHIPSYLINAFLWTYVNKPAYKCPSNLINFDFSGKKLSENCKRVCPVNFPVVFTA